MASVAFLHASEKLWKARHTFRSERLAAARAANDVALIEKWTRLRDEASAQLRERRAQLEAAEAPVAPRIITSTQLGLNFQWVWGSKGPVHRGAGHYTAGRRAKDAAELAAEMRADHRFHASKGWGGLSYEVMIADDGTIGLGNPVSRKSAAVAGQNTGMVSVCCPGTTGDRMTAAQKTSLAWLLDHWHTTAIPAAYRLPVRARNLTWRAHNAWPGQSTACPGAMKLDYEGAWG